jgi:hypothetical protein
LITPKIELLIDCVPLLLFSPQDPVTSGLASLSAMQSLGGFHMAAAAAAGIPHHQLMASAAAAAAAGRGSVGDLDQSELGAHHHGLGAPLTSLGVPHEYHHL